MTYYELIQDAEYKLNFNMITLGEYEEMIKPSKREIEQQPCEMTAEEYRQRMIQAFHNADTDRLIAVCVLPTEKEFEHLEWLLKNHYKKQPCEDCISREAAIDLIADYDLNIDQVVKGIHALPSVTPSYNSIKTELKPCEDCIGRKATIDALWKALYEYENKTEKQFIDSEELDIADWFQHRVFVQNMSDIDRQTILNMPPVTPSIPDVENNFNLGYNCGYADAMSDIAESEEV